MTSESTQILDNAIMDLINGTLYDNKDYITATAQILVDTGWNDPATSKYWHLPVIQEILLPLFMKTKESQSLNLDDFPYTDDQKKAMEVIVNFMASNDKYMILSGYSGTGKSSLLKVLPKLLPKIQMVFTAPTNKAVKVIANLTTGVTCSTIHSLLGLKMERDGQYKVLNSSFINTDLYTIDLVVVDEASMINEQLFDIIDDISRLNSVKFLFVGDPAQLPPINEIDSVIWRIEAARAHLETVVRYDSNLLLLATDIRNRIEPYSKLDIMEYMGKEDITILESKKQFIASLEGRLQGFLKDHKIVAWRNATVDYFNAEIRKHLFNDPDDLWVPGDRFILIEPVKLKGEEYLHTSTEGEVKEITVGTHPKVGEFLVYQLKVITEDGLDVVLYQLHDSEKGKFKERLNGLAEAAKAKPKLWRDYWSFKDNFHEIKHAYAITAHRAQGSTYHSVWVDYSDILSNPRKVEAMKCFYVASTRAASKLFIIN